MYEVTRMAKTVWFLAAEADRGEMPGLMVANEIVATQRLQGTSLP